MQLITSMDETELDPVKLLRSRPFIRYDRNAVVGTLIDNWLSSKRIQVFETMETCVTAGHILGKTIRRGNKNETSKSFKGLMINHAFQYFDYTLFQVDENNFRSQKAVKNLGGVLIDKNGPLKHLHTLKPNGLTFVLVNEKNT